MGGGRSSLLRTVPAQHLLPGCHGVMLKIKLGEIPRENGHFKGEEHLGLPYLKKYFWKDTNPPWDYITP